MTAFDSLSALGRDVQMFIQPTLLVLPRIFCSLMLLQNEPECKGGAKLSDCFHVVLRKTFRGQINSIVRCEMKSERKQFQL